MPIRLPFRAALAACLAIAACGGNAPTPGEPEPRVCTLMYVYPGLDIDVAGASTDAPITVEVVAGGEALTVEARASESGPQCGAGARNQDLGCAARNGRFEVSLAPPLPDQPAHLRVAHVDAPGGPSQLTITIRQGALATTQTLTPAYETTEPNGPGCGEVVKARAALSLSAPAP